MVKNIIHIEGMSCGMCEAHIADTIRHAFPHAAHVSASRSISVLYYVCKQNIGGYQHEKSIDFTNEICSRGR